MKIRKKFEKPEVRKEVLDQNIRTQLVDPDTEFALLWKAIENLYEHLNIEMPEECQNFRNKVKDMKNKIKGIGS